MYSFLVQQAPARITRSDERFQQLLRMFNKALQCQKETLRRHLSFYTLRIVPLSSHVRLIEDVPTHISLDDVLVRHCREHGISRDHGVMWAYRSRLEEAKRLAAGQQVNANFRREVFDRIRQRIVDSTVLNRYVSACLPDQTANWAFRKQFTNQLALHSVATYILGLMKGLPYTFRFVLNTGNIVPWELAPSWDQHQQLVPAADKVPFRLTPNFVYLISPTGITGPFSGSMLAAAQSLNDSDSLVRFLVQLIFRDDLIGMNSQLSESVRRSELSPSELGLRSRQVTYTVWQRLEQLAAFEGLHAPTDNLIKAATASGNLCNMQATWQPWL